MDGPGRIDVHHHLVPPAFKAAMRRRGIERVAGAPLPEWTPERSLGVMDANGIATALLSLSAPGVYFGDRAEAVSLSLACNEHAAEVAQAHPGRFGSFAVLPMPLVEESCREAVYALDKLGAAGVVLLASTDGVFLGDPRLDPLMAELNKRKAVVFVHPNIHQTSTQLGLDWPAFFVEFLCDTSRATANLIFSGTLERYPDIRWILSHAGGFVPYIAWRLALADGMPAIREKAPKGVLHYIRQLYFDTALSPSPYAMAALLQLVDPGHILFGSDFPFAPEPVVAAEGKSLEALPLFTAEVRAGVDRAHALKLFPQLSS